jgi:hypothetical protein
MSHFRSTLANGRLAIIHLAGGVIPGSSQELRFIDKTMFELSRDVITPPDGLTGEEVVKWRMNVHFQDYTGVVTLTCHKCEDSELPSDRHFRDAWEDAVDMVSTNMPKARVIHMDRIRTVRNIELEKESGSKYRQPEEIEDLFAPEHQARLQTLRDIPQTFSLGGFRTPETLKAAWPTELPPQ